ncbi:MAG: adenosylcobinamide-phosphate synthase CbiB [Huintestinicola sp.]
MRIAAAILPLLAGFLLDAMIGDPYNMPHPVRLMGSMISALEKKLRSAYPGDPEITGKLLVIIMTSVWFIIPAAVLIVLYKINITAGIAAESIMCFYAIAPRCLCSESMKVCSALRENDTEKARKAVSMIVGRDTAVLDEAGITKAAVETVAENCSDGVTAPIMWMALFGGAGAFLYKAVNTMDSMVGYKNEKYIRFGRAAARLDDFCNYFPARITALIMILSAFILRMDGKNAARIWKRDRRRHASPNSAQTESVCAGALDVMLAGDAWYFGELHKKETIGDDIRPIEAEDIVRANKLMYCTAVIVLLAVCVIRALLFAKFGVIMDE